MAPLDQNGPKPVPPPLRPGDPVPYFHARSDINDAFRFASCGGRYVLLTFVASFAEGAGKRTHDLLLAASARFAPFTSALLLVSADSNDMGASVPLELVVTRYFFDPDRRIAALFDAAPLPELRSYIIDERLRVYAIIDISDPDQHAAHALSIFASLPPLPGSAGATPQAPVIIVPRVFEPSLCQALIAGYERHGGMDSGFMVEADGKTVMRLDYGHKRRSDWVIDDRGLVAACHNRVERRLVPEIWRAFQFNVTRVERNLVACYSAETADHFNRHRDNTTSGTAHRRFAVSINLNADDYDGGYLVFPEFGRAQYRPPTGGACVFSCSLLHEATAVTRGKRYVYVPFLYDEAAAEVRQANLPSLSTGAGE